MRKEICMSVVFAALLFAPSVYAAGNIDSVNKYAWSNVGGYINFAPTSGGVTVTDSLVTGYAWSANDGWINFSASQGGVHNDGNGTLSGYAWDASAGWINFTGVTIDTSGLFHGSATGGTINGVSYAINFDCSHCAVVTTWRKVSSATTVGGGMIVGSAPLAPEANAVGGAANLMATSTWQPLPTEALILPKPIVKKLVHLQNVPSGPSAGPTHSTYGGVSNPYTVGTEPPAPATSTYAAPAQNTQQTIPAEQPVENPRTPTFLEAVSQLVRHFFETVFGLFHVK